MQARRCRAYVRFAFLAGTVLWVAACSTPPAPTDTGTDVPVADAADAQAIDAPGDVSPADVPRDTVVRPDVAPDAPRDAGACANFAGAYALQGNCSAPEVATFRGACVTQTGCTATLVVDTGTLTATVVGTDMTFRTTMGGMMVDCTGSLLAGELSISCASPDGVLVCDATGAAATAAGATRFCCDVSRQDCGAGLRCNVISDSPANMALFTACVPTGTVAAGAACVRTMERVGADDCGAGLYCTAVGRPTLTDRVCQPLCRSSADCAMGQVCFGASPTPRAGPCTPTCTLLGTDCVAGASCIPTATWGAPDATGAPPVIANVCLAHGTGADGATCMGNNDCGANLMCARASAAAMPACTFVCDMTHPCPGTRTCTAFTGSTNPAGAGFCSP